MNIILYVKKSCKPGIRLQEAISSNITNNRIEVFETVIDLSHRLLSPAGKEAVVIVMAADRKDLTSLVTIADLFGDKSTILILPDIHKDTFALGCKLFPRFVSQLDSDFSDVSAVLNNIITRNKNGRSGLSK